MIKVNDVIKITEEKFTTPRLQVSFKVVAKIKGLAGYRFKLDKIPGQKYVYSWDYKQTPANYWTAKELSSHYAEVYRNGKKLGAINTKYW